MKISIGKGLAAVILGLVAAWAAANLNPGTRLIAGIAIGAPSLILLIVSRVQIGKYFAPKG